MSCAVPGIHIEGISADCRIGPEAEERAIVQRILLDLLLDADLNAAGQADSIDLTVDYRAVTSTVLETAASREFRTLEGLASGVGRQVLLRFPLVQSTVVTVCKPGVPGRADRVRVVLRVDRPV